MAAPSHTQTTRSGATAPGLDLLARLKDAEETLLAIRTGEVDAVVVNSDSGPKVYALEGADFPYRVMVERIHEGAVTVDGDQFILYANPRFVEKVGTAERTLGGSQFSRFISEEKAAGFAA